MSRSLARSYLPVSISTGSTALNAWRLAQWLLMPQHVWAKEQRATMGAVPACLMVLH